MINQTANPLPTRMQTTESTRGLMQPETEFQIPRRPLAPRYRIEPVEGSEQHALKLWGNLPVGWSGALSLGCSRAGISILHGSAQRLTLYHWVSEFHVIPAAPGANPAGIDYIELSKQRSGMNTLPDIALERIDVRFADDPQEGIQLEVSGKDQLGLLGALLKRLTFFSLFPVEMNVSTTGEMVYDTFRLMGTGGRTPEPDLAGDLRQMLNEWFVHKS